MIKIPQEILDSDTYQLALNASKLKEFKIY